MCNVLLGTWKVKAKSVSSLNSANSKWRQSQLPSYGLDKLEMFGDQTRSNIVWWPDILMLKWVAKRLKHVWSNTGQTIDTSRWASVVRMLASNILLRGCQNDQTSPIKHENKRNVVSCLIECVMAYKFYQTRPNTIKQHQTSRPNGKTFGHQTMFDSVWSAITISCYDITKAKRALWLANSASTICPWVYAADVLTK